MVKKVFIFSTFVSAIGITLIAYARGIKDDNWRKLSLKSGKMSEVVAGEQGEFDEKGG